MSVLHTKARQDLRRKLFQKQDGKCWLCGQQMSLKPESPIYATLDHIIPLSKIPEGTIGRHANNTKLAHKRCNGIRGNQSHIIQIKT